MALNNEQTFAGWREIDKDRCGNCGAKLDVDDKYCKVCGTRVGDGDYKPFRFLEACVYGPPPIERTHVCVICGYSWKTEFMIDDQKYCPKCGGSAPYQE